MEMLLCKQGEGSAPSSVNTVLRAWFPFSERDASVWKNTLNILNIYIYITSIY